MRMVGALQAGFFTLESVGEVGNLLASFLLPQLASCDRYFYSQSPLRLAMFKNSSAAQMCFARCWINCKTNESTDGQWLGVDRASIVPNFVDNCHREHLNSLVSGFPKKSDITPSKISLLN